MAADLLKYEFNYMHANWPLTIKWCRPPSLPLQFLVLRLQQPAIVSSILFGKYEKSHACNLRKFRVHGGMDCEHMHLLAER